MTEPTLEEMMIRDATAKPAPEPVYCVNTLEGFHVLGTAIHSCSCCIAYTKLQQPAPESEEEAFERAWRQRVARGVPYDREEFRHGWNARARLDAERGK